MAKTIVVPEPWDASKMQHIPRSDDTPRMTKRPDGLWEYPPISDDISYGTDRAGPNSNQAIPNQFECVNGKLPMHETDRPRISRRAENA